MAYPNFQTVSEEKFSETGSFRYLAFSETQELRLV